MNAEDLRIGNYIHKSLKSGNGRTVVCNVMVYDITKIYDRTGYFIYEPIPLTEEWLLRLGFVKKDNPNNTPSWIWKKDGEVWFYQTWIGRDIFIKNFFPTNQKQINYVHQLQNLYFALTGEELTTNH